MRARIENHAPGTTRQGQGRDCPCAKARRADASPLGCPWEMNSRSRTSAIVKQRDQLATHDDLEFSCQQPRESEWLIVDDPPEPRGMSRPLDSTVETPLTCPKNGVHLQDFSTPPVRVPNCRAHPCRSPQCKRQHIVRPVNPNRIQTGKSSIRITPKRQRTEMGIHRREISD